MRKIRPKVIDVLIICSQKYRNDQGTSITSEWADYINLEQPLLEQWPLRWNGKEKKIEAWWMDGEKHSTLQHKMPKRGWVKGTRDTDYELV